MSKLVIVESPAKVKTIRKFLPPDFEVDSCVGHIRDLPANKSQIPKAIKDEEWADLGVDVDNAFEPVYVTIRGKGKVINQLKAKLRDAEALYLATDEDREGESISWHLTQALNPQVPVKRMVFNEITEEAIHEALENPRDLDMDLVQAQETRRILDRLYGYTLSPLLWKKIGGNLSAGRVQTPALRLIVNRERERRAFRSASYWDLKALLAKHGIDFEAALLEVDGDRVATGSDFDKDTGALAEGSDAIVLDEEQARALQAEVDGGTWTVSSVTERQRQSKPDPPFITSTLQQESNSRLDLSPGETMRVAQSLYEDGYITYMRTDSTTLSKEALEGARKAIVERWSAEMHERRTYEKDKSEGAQEAHEAIRPAGAEFQRPEDVPLSGKAKALYKLIYDRTLASQMPNERYTSTTVLVSVAQAVFKATGKRVDFPGYRLAYPTQGDSETELPELAEGDTVDCRELTAESHETKPPSRFTEASLVRALEEEGIGRPSTYAEIISKIIDKEYVAKKGRSLVPTLTAFAVVDLLEEHFPELVKPEFTAQMEKTLDRIATGETDWRPYLETFYLGDRGLRNQVAEKTEQIDPQKARIIGFEDLPVTVRVGPHGPYIEGEVDGEQVKADLPEDMEPDQLTIEALDKILERRAAGPQSLGTDPETGLDVLSLSGRYGPYVQLGDRDEVDGKPKRCSLPEDVAPEEVTLEDALYLLSLPREIGEHPDGGELLVGIGRYGPYVCHDPPGDAKRVYANVNSYKQLQSVTPEEALDLLAKKRKATKRGVIKTMGEHSETGDTIELRGGRYGPYFKMGDTNKSLPKGMDVDEASMEDALFLLSLPREIGEHPDGGRVFADLGRYGPYVCHETEGGDRTYANVDDFGKLATVELDEALELIAAEA